MNESIRTVVFVAVGAVVALGAYITKPNLERDDAVGVNEPAPGTQLFKDFKDPSVAKSLEIKQFDEAIAKVSNFVVTQQPSGIWTLPSHGNYPADAESQLKAVAETFSDLKIIGVAAKDNKEHELYGVNDPDKAEVGTKGVGTLITMQDNKGNDLLRMIVGKEVAGAANQRFVRKPSEDWVYVTGIDMSKLPTDFEKWIEKDLLKLSTFDVSRVQIKDYLVLPTQAGRMQLVQRMDANLTYDNSKGEWKAEELSNYRGRDRVPAPLGDLEELNKQKLDDLRNALGDLKIVDVRRKPDGLGNSLRVSTDKLPADQRRDLQELGFFPYDAPDGKQEIFGANGEVIIDTKDGVEYFLRFGEIKPQTATATSSTKKAGSGDKSAEDEVKVNRYLFVSTQVAPSVLTQPQLEPEPAGPEPAKEEKTKEGEKKEEAAKDDRKTDEQKTDEQKAAIVDPQQAERERIKKENERKMNAYRDAKTKAERRVTELNARFADWYYVVSEDVYKKIRLTRSDIVKEAAAAKDEGFGIDAFRKLEEDGVKGAAKPSN
jgi:hypothetical protein